MRISDILKIYNIKDKPRFISSGFLFYDSKSDRYFNAFLPSWCWLSPSGITTPGSGFISLAAEWDFLFDLQYKFSIKYDI